MLAESLFYALALVVLGQVQDLALQQLEAAWVVAAMKQTQLETLGRAVGFVGAGIYEEVLFRGALLPAIYLLVRGAQLPRKAALTAAVVLSSALFAAAHYWGPQSLAPDVRGFVFRATAGVLFGVLLVLRGIGITIGAHVAYDILVGVLLQPAL
jgi:membrane protease YdiL (CAAX protease family)